MHIGLFVVFFFSVSSFDDECVSMYLYEFTFVRSSYYYLLFFVFRLSAIAIFTATDICCCWVSLLSLWLCLRSFIKCVRVYWICICMCLCIYPFFFFLIFSYIFFCFYFRLLPMLVLFFLLSPMLSLCVYNLLLRFTQQTNIHRHTLTFNNFSVLYLVSLFNANIHLRMQCIKTLIIWLYWNGIFQYFNFCKFARFLMVSNCSV